MMMMTVVIHLVSLINHFSSQIFWILRLERQNCGIIKRQYLFLLFKKKKRQFFEKGFEPGDAIFKRYLVIKLLSNAAQVAEKVNAMTRGPKLQMGVKWFYCVQHCYGVAVQSSAKIVFSQVEKIRRRRRRRRRRNHFEGNNETISSNVHYSIGIHSS